MPSIGLNRIAKDEARASACGLAWTQPFIPRWARVNTGATQGTRWRQV